MKTCKKCGSQEFYNSGGCKQCARQRSKNNREINPDYAKSYRNENKDHIKKLNYEWREKNKDRVKEYSSSYHSERSNSKEFKESAKLRSKKWYEANKQKASEYSKTYKEKKRTELKEYSKLYYLKNKEKVKAYTKKWSLKNREKINKTRSLRRKSNPELHRSSSRMRKIKLAVSGRLSAGLTSKLFKLQRGKCACCGLPLGDDYHLDHIMPIALGGQNTDDNIQLLRAKCNQQKNAKHPIDFMQSRGFLL